MALDWNLAGKLPTFADQLQGFKQGQTDARDEQLRQAQIAAGQSYQAGDANAAAGQLAGAGDFANAIALSKDARATADDQEKQTHAALTQIAPALESARKKAEADAAASGADPTSAAQAGNQAAASAYQTYAPMLKIPADHSATIVSALAKDAPGSLQAILGPDKYKIENVNGHLLRTGERDASVAELGYYPNKPEDFTLGPNRYHGDGSLFVQGTPTEKGEWKERKKADGSSEFVYLPTNDGGAPQQSAAAPSSRSIGAGGFDAVYNGFVKPQEGGYTASDGNGAPANFGINQKANPDVDVAHLTPENAQQIYKDRYWGPSGADKLPPALQAIQFDTAVNMGVGTAQQMLQQSGGDPQKYLALRDARYKAIAANDPSKASSLPVWLQRNAALGQYVSGGQQAAPAATPGLRTVPGDQAPQDGAAGLSEDAKQQFAERFLTNGALPAFGMGKQAAKDREDILNRAASMEKTSGRTGAEAVAAAAGFRANASALTKLTTQTAAIDSFEQTARANGQTVRQLLSKGAGPATPLFNRPIQFLRQQLAGSPDVTALDAAITTYVSEVAKINSGNTGAAGASDATRREASKLVDPNATPKQILAAMDVLDRDMGNRTGALHKQLDQLRGNLVGGSPAKSGASITTASAVPVTKPLPAKPLKQWSDRDYKDALGL